MEPAIARRTEMIFCPGNLCQQPFIDQLLRTTSYRSSKLPTTSATSPGQFSAFLIIDGQLAGFAVGRYGSLFESVSLHSLPRDSVISWIEILPDFRRLGLCYGFMRFILEQLQRLGIDFVEIDNVGERAGCLCYFRAIDSLGGTAGYIEGRHFEPYNPEYCSTRYESINILVFPTARSFYPQFFQ